jgi:hypothetical protein
MVGSACPPAVSRLELSVQDPHRVADLRLAQPNPRTALPDECRLRVATGRGRDEAQVSADPTRPLPDISRTGRPFGAPCQRVAMSSVVALRQRAW